MIWIRMAAILMFGAVALGAFGAHALRDRLSPGSLDIYKTAVLYHFIHALGLFVVGFLSMQSTDIRLTAAGWLLVLGVVFFSGSLYILSVSGIKWFGAITPLGGLMFLSGWLLIAMARL